MVIIDLKNDDSHFDLYLSLQPEHGNIIQNDDDGGDNLNSKIIARLAPGRYKIVAGGHNKSSGAYELSLSTTNLINIAIGDTVNDTIKQVQMKAYEFTIKSEGIVRIQARRSDDSIFAPYIDLKSELGHQIANDINNGACACTELSTYLNPGTYLIFFKGYNDAGGSFALSISQKEYKAQEFTPISAGETRRGWILPVQKHMYDFTMPKSGYVMIDLVKDNSNLASDDDSAGDLNARI